MNKYSAFFFYYCLIVTTLLFVEAFYIALTPHSVLLPFVIVPIVIYLWLNMKRRPVTVIKHAPEAPADTLTLPPVPPTASKTPKKKTKQRLLLGAASIGMLTLYSVLVYRAFSQPSLAQLLEEQMLTSKEIKKIQQEVVSLQDIQSVKGSSDKTLASQIKEEIAKYKNSQLTDKDILSLISLPGSANTSSVAAAQSQQGENTNRYVTIKNAQWQTLDVYSEKYSSSKVMGQIRYGVTYISPKKEGDYYYLQLSPDAKGWVLSQYLKEI